MPGNWTKGRSWKRLISNTSAYHTISNRVLFFIRKIFFGGGERLRKTFWVLELFHSGRVFVRTKTITSKGTQTTIIIITMTIRVERPRPLAARRRNTVRRGPAARWRWRCAPPSMTGKIFAIRDSRYYNNNKYDRTHNCVGVFGALEKYDDNKKATRQPTDQLGQHS